MEHTIRVTASTPDAIAAAAAASNAISYQTFPAGQGFVGLVRVGSLSQRQILRQSGAQIVPHFSSPSDISKHANTLGLKAKTARDLHAAIFALIDVDEFDPDL